MSEPTPSELPGAPASAADGDAARPVVPPPGSHPVLRYTAARFALLVGVGAVLYVLQVRGVWLLLFAFLISGAIAMVALSRTREGAAYGITSAVRGLNEKIDASSRAEDDAVRAEGAAAAGQVPAPDDVAGAAPERPAEAAEPDVPLDDWDDPAPR